MIMTKNSNQGVAYPLTGAIYRGYSNVFVEYSFYFIECSGKYSYFMSGEATNEIYIFFTSRGK